MSEDGDALERWLRLMAQRRASDLYLSADAPVLARVQGQVQPFTEQPLPVDAPRALLAGMLSPAQLKQLDDTGELNTGLSLPGVGVFRLSAFRQRGSIAAVLRHIPTRIPALETLGLPEVLARLALEPRGLVLMVGATGSGKSTTLAAMLEQRNRTLPGHILTIEDPIEFVFTNQRSVVNQREIGRDTASLEVALRNALRQAPDCILIGEIRDRETMTAALSYALSGHLVLATLHASSSHHALGRVLSFFPPEARTVLLADLAAGLKAVVSQRLLRTGAGPRVPASEVLLNTALVADLIRRGDLGGLRESLEKSLAEGSQSFEQDLARLVRAGTVTRDEALAQADSPTNLLWRLQNESAAPSRVVPPPPEPEEATFTDITLDVHDATSESSPSWQRPV